MSRNREAILAHETGDGFEFAARALPRRRLELWLAAVYGLAFLFAAYQSWQIFLRGGDAYRVGDWLINYSGGFVRRGLIGSFFLACGQAFPGGLLPLLLSLQLLCLGGLLWFGHRMLSAELERRRSLAIFALSPATVLFDALNPQAFRKELLGLVLFAWFCRDLQVGGPARERKIGLWMGLLTVLGPALILSHEAMVLLVPYWVTAAWLASARPRSHLPKIGASLSLSALSLVLVVWRKGDAEVVNTILGSLRGLIPDASLLHRGELGQGAIFALADSSSAAATRLGARVSAFGYGYAAKYVVIVALSAAALVPLRSEWAVGFRSTPVRAGWAAALIMTLVLCVVAKDWGRFIHLNVTALGLVLLLRSSQGAPLRHAPTFGFGPTQGWLLLAVLAVYSLTWRVPISEPSFDRGWIVQVMGIRRDFTRQGSSTVGSSEDGWNRRPARREFVAARPHLDPRTFASWPRAGRSLACHRPGCE